MASNSFGTLFRITTFGESHGPAIGVVIDGCPAGVPITLQEIETELDRRRPGKSPYTSPRNESDQPEILSGIHEGVTTGAPIAILIRNHDADSSQYTHLKEVLRPGHANFTYMKKYGVFDHRGGGRASARETAARVAAGAVAKKLLAASAIDCVAYLAEAGGIGCGEVDTGNLELLRRQVAESGIFCPNEKGSAAIRQRLDAVKAEMDSVGAIVGCVAKVPAGLGDPVYGKIEAMLASAMLSLPATKGFEIGEGFAAARMKGSEHNDLFSTDDEGNIVTTTNYSGGTLGGITHGGLLSFRVAFKPTSSIKKPQQTVDLKGNPAIIELPVSARHDPCVGIRAVPIVEAMTAIVLADALLMHRCSSLAYNVSFESKTAER